MHLLLLGISHRTAPVDVRERIDFHARGLESALRALTSRRAASEAVIVSTCNRAELYTAVDDVGAAREDLKTFVSEYHGLDRAVVTPHIYGQVDLDAARHLFRVAAGLDSLVVGEPQILGQVKEAYHAAGAAHTSGALLNRLFHCSFGVGKRVRSETGLGSGAVSVSFAAVALAKKIFGELKGLNVLVIGAGEMGKLTALHMKSQGVSQVTIVSRTMARAARTAEAIGGAAAAPMEELDALLGRADIVITATGASTAVLTRSHIESIMRPRRNRPLFLIDIAMPRDVEPSAGDIEQVFLYNIDDLQATVRENMARRASEVERAEAIVTEELEKFGQWLRSRHAVPTVVALRQHFEHIRRAELDRLASTLPPDTRNRVEDITRLLVEKLLLTPTEQLKSSTDRETTAAYAEALTRLFGLDPKSPHAEPGAHDDRTHRPERKVEPFVRPGSR